MQAIIVKEFGSADKLSLVNVPAPSPREDEIIIDVEAAGVGLVDILQRRGLLGNAAPGFIPGVEVAGKVLQVGAGVDGDLVGQRVFALGQGGYAERFVARAGKAVVLPPPLSPTEAVSLGASALVAHFSIMRAGLKAGESVLVRGASGGIGAMAAQMAVKAGARVTAVTSTTAADSVAALGVEHVIRRDVGARPEGPFDVIIDPVAGDAVPDLFATLKPNGRYIINGAAAGFPPAGIDQLMLQNFPRSLSYALFSLDSVADDALAAAAVAIFADAARGALRPLIAEILPLREASRAHELLEKGGNFGKIVLQP